MRKLLVVSIIGILLGTALVPVVNTIDIRTDSTSKTRDITQISGNGDTLYVGGSGPNNYTKVQDAIDDASDGDIVFVYDDSSPYYENIKINKSIHLTGENRDTTIIDGSRSGTVIYIKADRTKISGFTIRNSGSSSGKDPPYRGIYVRSNYNTIQRNTIRDNQVGIQFYLSSNNTLDDNVLYDDIALTKSKNNTIIGNAINDIASSVGLYESCNNAIINNVITGCCVMLSYSNGNVLRGNTMMGCGLEIHGRYPSDFWNDVDTSNNVNNKPIYYYVNQTDITIPDDAGEVILVNCSGCILSHLTLKGGTLGIGLAYCDNVTITGNSVYDNKQVGIRLWETTYTCITDNVIDHNSNGLELFSINYHNDIANNVIRYNEIGIRLIGGIHNNIWKNTVVSNQIGIALDTCGNNTLQENIVSHNRDYGISQYASSHNTISENTLDSNGKAGIQLSSSGGNVLMNNRMNGCGLEIDGNSLADYVNEIDTTNTVNEKPIYYYLHKRNATISDDAGEVILVNCSDCVLSNLMLCEGSIGIELVYSTRNSVLENTISWNNIYGVYMYHSDDNMLINNTISHNSRGVMLHGSNSTLHRNNIYRNKYCGLYVGDCTVDARKNWWGSITGPSLFGVLGDRIIFWELMNGSHHVYIFPWLLFPNPYLWSDGVSMKTTFGNV